MDARVQMGWLYLGDLEPGMKVLYSPMRVPTEGGGASRRARVVSCQNHTAVIEFEDGSIEAVEANACTPEEK
jgi:hypothetical protein